MSSIEQPSVVPAEPTDLPELAEAAPEPEPPAEERHTLTGDIRSHAGFPSRYLDVPHDVLVYLPPGYHDEPERRYPVLYLHDGQNLFDDATAFSREWGVDEAAERLIAEGAVEPLVIVALYNAGERRIAEYTPTRVAEHPASGRAERHGRMLVEELKPFIDATYRTRPDPASTGLGGSSLGGLVTLFLGLKYSGTFWRLAVISPSVWWDDRFLLRRVRALSFKPPLRIWLSVGTDEGAGVLEDAEALRDVLVSKGWREGDDLHFRRIDGGHHSEADWAAVVEPVLRWLYPAVSDTD